MQQKKIILIVIVALLVIGGVLYFKNKKNEQAAPADNSAQIAPVRKEICYYKETVGTQSTDRSFTSINYDESNKVHGLINTIPGEKDSLVGTYTGIIEVNPDPMPGYPTRLNIIYDAYGEGILSHMQEVIAISDLDIKTGTGEMVKGADGVWKIKDMKKLVYDNALPQVDCSIVPQNLRTDYSKTQ